MTYGKRVADHIRDDPVTSEGGHSPDHPEAGEPAEPTAVEPGPAATARRLDTPGDGVPPVVADPDALRRVTEAMAAGSGPVAVDAERASATATGNAHSWSSCAGRAPAPHSSIPPP